MLRPVLWSDASKLSDGLKVILVTQKKVATRLHRYLLVVSL